MCVRELDSVITQDSTILLHCLNGVKIHPLQTDVISDVIILSYKIAGGIFWSDEMSRILRLHILQVQGCCHSRSRLVFFVLTVNFF